VKTYGGREHHYSAEELVEMAFEIVEEPNNRPVVQIEMGFRTDY
jgi:gluconate kinase